VGFWNSYFTSSPMLGALRRRQRRPRRPSCACDLTSAFTVETANHPATEGHQDRRKQQLSSLRRIRERKLLPGAGRDVSRHNARAPEHDWRGSGGFRVGGFSVAGLYERESNDGVPNPNPLALKVDACVHDETSRPGGSRDAPEVIVTAIDGRRRVSEVWTIQHTDRIQAEFKFT